MATVKRYTVVPIVHRFNGENSTFFDRECIGFSAVFVVVALCLVVPLVFIQIQAYRSVRCLCVEGAISGTNQTLGEYALVQRPNGTAAGSNLSGELESSGEYGYDFSEILGGRLSTNISGFKRRDVESSDFNEVNYNQVKLPDDIEVLSNYTEEFEESTQEINRDPRERDFNDPSAFLFDVVHKGCHRSTACLKCRRPRTTKRPDLDMYSGIRCGPVTECQQATIPFCHTTTLTTTSGCQTTTTTTLCPTTTRKCRKKVCLMITECIDTTKYDCEVEPPWSFPVAPFKVTPIVGSTDSNGNLITYPTRPPLKFFPPWWSCRSRCTKTTTCEYETTTYCVTMNQCIVHSSCQTVISGCYGNGCNYGGQSIE